MLLEMNWNQKFFRHCVQECEFISSLCFYLFKNVAWVLMNTKHCSIHKFMLEHFPTEYQGKTNEKRRYGYISWTMYFFKFYTYDEQNISSLVEYKAKSLTPESAYSVTSWPHHLLALQPWTSQINSHNYWLVTGYGLKE